MTIIQSVLIFLLLFGLIAGMSGVFCYKNYLRKIACLATCYINLIIILIIVSENSTRSTQILDITTSLLILFSITLTVGAGIIFNITKPLKSDRNYTK